MLDAYEQTYEQLVKLLKAEPTFYDVDGSKAAAQDRSVIWINNFTEFTGTIRTNPKPQKPSVNETDYPLAMLTEEVQQDGGIVPTFATSRTNALPTCNWLETSQATWLLTLIGQDARTKPVSALRWGAKLALLKGGAKLGFAANTPIWRCLSKWRFQSQSPPLGTMNTNAGAPQWQPTQRVIHCRITVQYDFNGADVIA